MRMLCWPGRLLSARDEAAREDPEKSRELAKRLDELGKANELVIYPGVAFLRRNDVSAGDR